MMNKITWLFYLLVFAPQFCLGQKLKIYTKTMLGTELPVKIFKQKSPQYPYNFNRAFFVYQPFALMGVWRDKMGFELQGEYGTFLTHYTRDQETTYPGQGNKTFYVSKHNFPKSGEEYLKFRMGLLYNFNSGQFSIKPKLLAGILIFEANDVGGTLKEHGTNLYYTASNSPVQSSNRFHFLSLSTGINISRNWGNSRNWGRVAALNLEVLYNYANTPFNVSSELTNDYTLQKTSHIIAQKAGIRSLTLALGVSFYMNRGRKKTAPDGSGESDN